MRVSGRMNKFNISVTPIIRIGSTLKMNVDCVRDDQSVAPTEALTPTAKAIDDSEDSETEIDECKDFEPESQLYLGQYFKIEAKTAPANETSVLGKRTHRETIDGTINNKAA